MIKKTATQTSEYLQQEPPKCSQMCSQHDVWHDDDDVKWNLLAQLLFVAEIGRLVDGVTKIICSEIERFLYNYIGIQTPYVNVCVVAL